jgi:hypothetical protein
METKLFELRDRGTFVPLLCVKPWAGETRHPFEDKMAWRYGYKDNPAVIVTHMSTPSRGCHNDPHAWGDRTFHVAHDYIQKHWDELRTGHVVDVEFILGETLTPKESEA